MDVARKKKLDAQTKIIKALAHPTRLFIVQELTGRIRCVCELTDMIGADISTVSKHLTVLKSAGIIEDTKQGTQVFYSLKTPCILKFLNCVDSVLKGSIQEQCDLFE